MDLLEDIFQPYGHVQWDDLINPLWAELVSRVEEAWLALDSGFINRMRSASRSPAYLAPQHSNLRWIAMKLPRPNENSLEGHFPASCLCQSSHLRGGGG